MDSETRPREPRDPASIITSVMVALVLLAVGVIGYVIYDNSLRTETVTRTVVDGSIVTLNYIGMFQDGRVFDTSIYEVASDHALYPKSLTFSMREPDSYYPFEMTAGLYGESGGTIKGFALGVIGMKLNERKIVVVPPEDGYAVKPDMLETIALSESVAVVETVTEDEFWNRFSVFPTLQSYIAHYKWGWNVLVVSIEHGMVTYKNVPTVGQVLTPYGDPDDQYGPMGWRCVVESYDGSYDSGAGRIVVRHLISEADVYNKKGTEPDGTTFVLSSLDPVAGTFQIHRSDPEIGYNGEISGRTLLFQITIINIR